MTIFELPRAELSYWIFLPGFSLAIVPISAERKGSLGDAEVLGIFVSSVFS